LRATNPKTLTLVLSLSTLILLPSTPNSALILICCSSFILTAIAGVLAGLTDAKTHKGAPAPMGSLSGRSSLDFHGDP
jgi:threonine/homoserine/homoserine lactone efflux protein